MFKTESYLKLKKISNITNSTKNIKKNSAFFAIKGSNTDGNKYISEAIKQGAKIIISNNKKELNKIKNNEIIKIFSGDIRKFYSEECSRVNDYPSTKVKICGITGTNGKTSIATMLRYIWGAKYSGLIGTIENSYGYHKIKSVLTTPDTSELNKLINKMCKSKIKEIFLEVSSHALEQKRVSSIHFDTAIFTNITQDHLDYHKTMNNYFLSKQLLFNFYLKESIKKKKYAIVNIDDKYGRRILKNKIKGIKYFSYSMKDSSADFFLKEIIKKNIYNELLIKNNKNIFLLKTKMFGAYNFQNILACFAYSMIWKKPYSETFEKIKKFKGAAGRLEPITLNKLKVFIDYAHTPDALEKSLKAIRSEYANHTIILVFGCGGNRDISKRSKMGTIAERYSDFIILTNDNPRYETPIKIIRDIKRGIKSRNKVVTIINREKAIISGLKKLNNKSVILIAGKGHEDYQEINGEKISFSDHNVVKNFIENESI